jgi:hypothetical protein
MSRPTADDVRKALADALNVETRSLAAARRYVAASIEPVLSEGGEDPIQDLYDHLGDLEEAIRNIKRALNNVGKR